MAAQPALFPGPSAPHGAGGPGVVGDPLERVYTPDPCALAVCEWASVLWPAKIRTVVEASVGGGAFVRAARKVWPDATIAGQDVDPAAEGLPRCDLWRIGDTAASTPGDLWHGPRGLRTLRAVDLVIGNPPFSEGAMVAQWLAVRQTWPRAWLVWILPAAYTGTDWAAMCRPAGYLHHVAPVMPRPWPDRVREINAYAWGPARHETAVLHPPIVWR